jgi:hypothetical protein
LLRLFAHLDIPILLILDRAVDVHGNVEPCVVLMPPCRGTGHLVSGLPIGVLEFDRVLGRFLAHPVQHARGITARPIKVNGIPIEDKPYPKVSLRAKNHLTVERL